MLPGPFGLLLHCNSSRFDGRQSHLRFAPHWRAFDANYLIDNQ
jgi:hypothetical protein